MDRKTRIIVMRYRWGAERAHKGNKVRRGRRKKRKEGVRDKNREAETERDAQKRKWRTNEQQNGAASSILVQVGSAPDIFFQPTGSQSLCFH